MSHPTAKIDLSEQRKGAPMNPIRHTGLLVALVALFISLSLPGYTLPPAKKDPQAFESARKRYMNTRGSLGFAALHDAVFNKKPEYARYLVKMGADVDVQSINERWSPLHIAASLNYLEMARVLLELGAEVDSPDHWNYTPLHYACKSGHYEMAKLLIANGAAVNAISDYGKTPLDGTATGEQLRIRDLLLRHGAVSGFTHYKERIKTGGKGIFRTVFESNPPGARVEVDGKHSCKETPCSLNLRPGIYQVTMQRPWNYHRAAEVKVKRGMKISWTLRHRPPRVNVLVLHKGWASQYGHAIGGFKAAYRGSMEVKSLYKDGNKLKRTAGAVQRMNPGIIVTVGLGASKWATRNIHNIPIIFCMSLSPVHNGLKTPVSTGVALDAPPKDQLRAFRQAIPTLRSVGIVFNPRRTASFVLDANLAARKLGLRIVTRQVSTEREAAPAMWELAKEVDALWMIRDATTVTESTFSEAMLIQSQRKIPVLAYTEAFVPKCAFASYSADYEEQGELAAQIAKQIDDGALPRDIPVQHPTGGLMINLDVAEQLSSRFKIPPDVLFRGDVRKYKESWGLEKDLTIEKRRMR